MKLNLLVKSRDQPGLCEIGRNILIWTNHLIWMDKYTRVNTTLISSRNIRSLSEIAERVTGITGGFPGFCQKLYIHCPKVEIQ